MAWNAALADYTGLRILVTEDNALYGEIIAELLTLCHADVSRACSGEEAVRLIHDNAQRFDAVLMDVQMPGMDGYEATRAIRALEHGAGVPVFAMTGSTQERDRKRAKDVGMNAYLTKPLDLSMLGRALEAVYA